MKALSCAVALAAALVGGAAHAATTITFAPLTSYYGGYPADGYQEGGLEFNSSQPGYLFNWGASDPFNADPTGATLMVSGANLFLVVTKAGGGAFDLLSFDLSTGFNDRGGSVPFSYTDATGTYSSVLQLDNLRGLQTLSLNLKGVTRFTLQETPSKFFQVDNIVVDFPQVSPVPEPATWAMMILGLGGVGAALRRRRTLAAA